MKTLKSRSLAVVSGKSPENKSTVMSNDAFYVTQPPCFWLHFLTDESIGAQSPDI